VAERIDDDLTRAEAALPMAAAKDAMAAAGAIGRSRGSGREHVRASRWIPIGASHSRSLNGQPAPWMAMLDVLALGFACPLSSFGYEPATTAHQSTKGSTSRGQRPSTLGAPAESISGTGCRPKESREIGARSS